MIKSLYKPFLALLVCCLLFSNIKAQTTAQATKSEWVYTDAKGKLKYKTLQTGDQIMDFSYAGYMGDGVSTPMPEVKITLKPLVGDNNPEYALSCRFCCWANI